MKVLFALMTLMPLSALATEYDLKAYTHYHAQREQREAEQRAKCEAAREVVHGYHQAVVADFVRRNGGGTELDMNRQFRTNGSSCSLDLDRRPMIVCYNSSQLPPLIEVIETPLPFVDYYCEVQYPAKAQKPARRSSKRG